MPEPYAAALADAFATRRDLLLARARQVLDAAGSSAKWTDEDLGQLLNAFTAMVREALERGESQTRELLLETAIPAAIAQGETSASLVKANVMFATLIATEVVADLPEDQREDALVWLAGFFGEYVCEMLEAAERAKADAQ